MKKLVFLLLIVSMLTQCWNDWDYENYSEYKPVLMDRIALENSIAFNEARQMCTTGKIYFKDDFIYINEIYKGIHVIDNSNPAVPVNKGFISVPGSVDLAMKNDILYVDNAVDLVAIDLSNGLENLSVTTRLKSVFPELTTPDGKSLKPDYSLENRPENTIIVAWEKE